MQLPHYLVMLAGTERMLDSAYRRMATGHASVADVAFACAAFAPQARHRADRAEDLTRRRYPPVGPAPDRLLPPAFTGPRTGPLGLLRDLGGLQQLAVFVQTTWGLVEQAGYGARDRELIALAAHCGDRLRVQTAWLQATLQGEAAQALLAAGG